MFAAIKRWFAEERRKRREVKERLKPEIEKLKQEIKGDQGTAAPPNSDRTARR
jgi:hypothetical protein